jgi:uncharacterized protein
MLQKSFWKTLLVGTGVFLLMYYLPLESFRFNGIIYESLALAKWYAREHVILCLIPALFIAGAISVFLSQASVMKYLGRGANKFMAYSVASISGSVLAVCSCTILPLFAGIHRMGAGLGPASSFLYAGPAINILAVVLTAKVLGPELGLARAVGAILFSIVIGLLMQLIFRNDNENNPQIEASLPEDETTRPLGQTVIYFALMIGILLFANISESGAQSGLWYNIFLFKWYITSFLSLLFALVLIFWFNIQWWKILPVILIAAIFGFFFNGFALPIFAFAIIALSVILIKSGGKNKDWFDAGYDLAKQIFPLLFIGILVAGALLGRPGSEGLIRPEWISALVGGNSIFANLFASVVGAFMYFATLTEIPILQGLLAGGMGKGPALALLLAGPALSLPNMLVIRSVIGTKKTIVFVLLVIIMATISGFVYGTIF